MKKGYDYWSLLAGPRDVDLQLAWVRTRASRSRWLKQGRRTMHLNLLSANEHPSELAWLPLRSVVSPAARVWEWSTRRPGP